MSKFQRNKTKSYTTINNGVVRDKRISLKAKGLMLTIMALPENWDFSVRGIISLMREQKAAVYSAIDELIEFGYCEREEIREKGKFIGCNYTFNEQPYPEKPHTENRDTENRTQYKSLKHKGYSEEKDKYAVEIFETWAEVLGHPKAVCDEKRKKYIISRLDDGFSVEDLKRVPYGVKNSPYHLGENPTGTRYDGVTTVYRDADQVEKFIALAPSTNGNGRKLGEFSR